MSLGVCVKLDDAVRGKSTILICVCISALCVLAYTPLITLMPKKRNVEADKKRFRTVDDYFEMSEEELRKMTLEEMAFIGEQMMAEDPPRCRCKFCSMPVCVCVYVCVSNEGMVPHRMPTSLVREQIL